MNVISWVMAIFAVSGAVDLIFGNRLGLGKEFEKGMMMLGTLALTMAGMIVLAPFIAHYLFPALKSLSTIIPFEPSVVAGLLLANDMGGATLATEFASSEAIGAYNGLVVASMMGATVSFTLPFALGATEQSQRKNLMLGLMCGVCGIPVGCIVAGLLCGLSFGAVLFDLYPLLLFSAIIVFGLWRFPNASVKVFNVVGIIVKIIVTVGLTVGIVEALLDIKILPYAAPISDAFAIVEDVALIEAGAFPLVYIASKLLKKPLQSLGKKSGINETAALGFLSTLATSVTTFGMMKDMDERGVLLNSAFAVSAAFTFADHLAFTLSFRPSYVPFVIVGKLISGVAALAVAVLLFCRKKTETLQAATQVVDEK